MFKQMRKQIRMQKLMNKQSKNDLTNINNKTINQIIFSFSGPLSDGDKD